MKAVIYARYSSDSQREESIEGQLRECTAFAEKMASQFYAITLTVLFLPRPITALSFKT